MKPRLVELPGTPARLVKSATHVHFELIGHKDLDGGVITFSGTSQVSTTSAKDVARARVAELEKHGMKARVSDVEVGVYDGIVVEAGPPYAGNPHVSRQLYLQTGGMTHVFGCFWEDRGGMPAAAAAYFASIKPGPKADTKKAGGCGCEMASGSFHATFALLPALLVLCVRRVGGLGAACRAMVF